MARGRMRICHNADLQTTQIGITSTPVPIGLETFGYQRKQRPKARVEMDQLAAGGNINVCVLSHISFEQCALSKRNETFSDAEAPVLVSHT